MVRWEVREFFLKAIVYIKDGFWKKFVLLWSFMQS